MCKQHGTARLARGNLECAGEFPVYAIDRDQLVPMIHLGLP